MNNKTIEELQEDLDGMKAFDKYEDDLVKQNPIIEAFMDANESKNKEEENKLRDHFAGLALKSLIEVKSCKNSVGEYNAFEISTKAYKIADAMLEARKEANNG